MILYFVVQRKLMVNMMQYTIITILTAVTLLFFQGIGNGSVPIAMAADSQNSEIQTHLTEVQKALDNNDIQGAKTYLSAAMGLL
jgi:hypothetical protein